MRRGSPLPCRRLLDSEDVQLILNYNKPCPCGAVYEDTGAPKMSMKCCGWKVEFDQVGGWRDRRAWQRGGVSARGNVREIACCLPLQTAQGGVLWPLYHQCECNNEFDPLTNPKGRGFFCCSCLMRLRAPMSAPMALLSHRRVPHLQGAAPCTCSSILLTLAWRVCCCRLQEPQA